jgi:APA family basic amino acid/polyamine antiporter
MAARLTARAGTPGVATALQLGMTLLLLWTGSCESIIIYTSIGLSLFSMLSMSSIFVLRRKLPDLPRPFRTPGYPLTPTVYLVLTALLIVAAFFWKPLESAISLVSILAGIPIYYIWKQRTTSSTRVDPG